jgi:AcrR family transcriptional regulator
MRVSLSSESDTLSDMGEPVKRTYDNSRRRSQVRATRGEVVKAAHALFVARGYTATTVDAIADAAGVPPATVYRHFGGKRGILTAVLDVAFGGDDEPVEYQHRPEVRAALSDPDSAGMLDAFARLHPDVVARSAPIQHVLGEAAAADHEAAELLALARNQRHTGQSRIARLLAERGALAEGLTEAEAADVIYALFSPEVYRIFVVERGWQPERYGQWLSKALREALLPQSSRDVSSGDRG